MNENIVFIVHACEDVVTAQQVSPRRARRIWKEHVIIHAESTCWWTPSCAAFKDSTTHGILQFTLRIAFRCVLHRCESQDIRCRELSLLDRRGVPVRSCFRAEGFMGCRRRSAGGGGVSPPAPTGRFRVRRAKARKFSGISLIGFNDPSAGSPTETLLQLLLPLSGRVQRNSRNDGQETGPKFQS